MAFDLQGYVHRHASSLAEMCDSAVLLVSRVNHNGEREFVCEEIGNPFAAEGMAREYILKAEELVKMKTWRDAPDDDDDGFNLIPAGMNV